LIVEDATKKFPEEAGIARFGKPEEIADLLAYMVSPAAKWMTGASVRMDGGGIKASELQSPRCIALRAVTGPDSTGRTYASAKSEPGALGGVL
jgi:hypothetical protein